MSTGASAEGSARSWSVERFAQVDSTQTIARGRPAWSAVVAGEQRAGRGQAERSFTSDPGGVYVTAVLPYAGDPLASRGFALAVGWALCGMLRKLGVPQVRLRWPNDLMVGARKVGGILVEQDGVGTLLVGVGLNVSNRPWLADAALRSTAGRLADFLAGDALPGVDQFAGEILAAICLSHETFARERLEGFAPRLGDCWGPAREVVIEPAGGVARTEVRGLFAGIDRDGRVLVQVAGRGTVAIPAHEVGRLREGA